MNPLIIALDFDSTEPALKLIHEIGSAADFYKIGMELYAVAGMEFVRRVAGLGKRVFVDLKLYDIGETVKRATAQICSTGAATFLTVHGSRPVMKAAVEGRAETQTKLLAVTVLTSFDQEDLQDLGYPVAVTDLVDFRVQKALETGMDGVVCSALDVARIRKAAGEKLKIITPGVRSAGAGKGDQKRVATPAEAIRDGADYLVIGRQATRSQDPRGECERILEEIAAEREMPTAPRARSCSLPTSKRI